MRVRAAIALLLVFLVPGPVSAGRSDRIVFSRQSKYPKPFVIFSVRADGERERRLREGAEGPVQWSPDRSLIAFSRETCASRDDCDAFIYVMNPDGSGVHRFAGGADHVGEFDWSPDARQIVYEACDSQRNDCDLQIATAGRRRATKLTDTPDSFEFGPDWSPDESSIVFEREGEVFSISPDGTDERNLTNHEDFDGSPRWSPDGEKIAFTTTRDDTSEGPDAPYSSQLYAMDADGSDPVRVSTNEDLFKLNPQWSRDSVYLAWHEDCGAEGCVDDLWVGAADGSDTRNITQTDDLYELEPQWSADGQRLVFMRFRNHSYYTDLFSIRVDGTGVRRLTRSPGTELFFFDWQTW